ncbi:MAG: copper resistance protein CopC [Pseudohongiellaceae bacterium]
MGGKEKDHDLASCWRKAIAAVLLSTGFLCVLLDSSAVLAQGDMHSMTKHGGLHVSTMPANNEVIAMAPQKIILDFDSEVRLVKLALKEKTQGEILINFRFDPTSGRHYTQSLPPLLAADYYKVEWAALDASGKLARGSFYFSFGDNAKPPSSYMGEMDHQMQIISPDYRLL